MAYFSYSSLAIFCIIAFSVCGGIPRPDTATETKNVNTAIDNGSLKISQWLRPAVASGNRNIHVDAGTGLNYFKEQDSSFKGVEDAVNNEDPKFGAKLIPTTFSKADTINPFVRSKRSICATPINLPQMVIELNSRLNHAQFIGLNPEDSIPATRPTHQQYTCPNTTTSSWWPGSEDNLRSTCPWTMEPTDLGENAFPRYVNSATCMCSECLGSPSMRCKEIFYTMTYLVRTGCENGLALLETAVHSITVGCHCASAGPNLLPPDVTDPRQIE